MYRNLFSLLVVLISTGCSVSDLPPHNLLDSATNYNLKVPVGFQTWSAEHQQTWLQLDERQKETKNKYDNDLNNLRKSHQEKQNKLSEEIELSEKKISQLKSNTSRSEVNNNVLKNLEEKLTQLRLQFTNNAKKYASSFRQLIDKFKKEIFKLDIKISKFISLIANGTNESDEDDDDDPRDTPPPTIFGEEIDPTTLTGYEVFINIGGVAGSSLEGPAQAALVAGYEKLGFRVNLINDATRWNPMQQRMQYVSSVYQVNNIELVYVVFHHGGHGWEDRIKYESRAKDAQGAYTKERGTPTPHQTIFSTLGSTFPKTITQFPNTVFGVVLDACAQGNAVDRSVSGRQGFVATATPAIRWYHIKREAYYYSGTYIYSNYFGQYLQRIDSIDEPHVKTEVLRNAHRYANRLSASSSMGNGEYKQY